MKGKERSSKSQSPRAPSVAWPMRRGQKTRRPTPAPGLRAPVPAHGLRAPAGPPYAMLVTTPAKSGVALW